MPRHSLKNDHALPDQTVVVDNGAYTMKAGFVTESPNPTSDCHIIPNCLAKSRDNRVYIGAQLETCIDYGDMTFRRPIQKGHLVNWEAEREIWDKTFFEKDAALKVRRPSFYHHMF
jgi:actin-related protein 6